MTYHSKGQKEIVLNHLKEFGSITSWTAIQEYGITRLSDVILRLRREGYDIITKTQSGKDRRGKSSSYAKYVFLEQIPTGDTYNLNFA